MNLRDGFVKFYPQMLVVANRKMGNEENAEDLVQEAILRSLEIESKMPEDINASFACLRVADCKYRITKNRATSGNYFWTGDVRLDAEVPNTDLCKIDLVVDESADIETKYRQLEICEVIESFHTALTPKGKRSIEKYMVSEKLGDAESVKMVLRERLFRSGRLLDKAKSLCE